MKKTVYFSIFTGVLSLFSVNGFSQSVVVGVPTLQIKTEGFENSEGVVTAGMPWGIVVDTASQGFGGLSSGNLVSFDLGSLAYEPANPFELSFTSNETGIYFYRANTDTETGGSLSGYIDAYANLPVNGSGNESSTSDPFGILFFESDASVGASYGFTAGSGVVLPNGNAGTVDYSSDFSATSASLSLEAIPEPSAYATILGVFGLAYAAFRRRRRSSSRE